MHPALLIEEIIRIIFLHCHAQHRAWLQWEESHYSPDLVTLARTCQAFKTPALDVLWMQLHDITPLLRCLPGAFRTMTSESTGFKFDPPHLIYMFKRALDATELDTVKRYACRVRALSISYPVRVDPQSVADLCHAPMAGPLFPNIQRLYFSVSKTTIPLIHHVAVPNLMSLHFRHGLSESEIASCENFICLVGKGCPNLKTINTASGYLGRNEIMTQSIPRWKHLQHMSCPNDCLSLDTLSHLSSLVGLKELSFKICPELTDQCAASDRMLVFPVLRQIEIAIGSDISLSNLIARLRLPAVLIFHISLYRTFPSARAIKSCLSAIQDVCTREFSLYIITYSSPVDTPDLETSPLVFEHLRPISALNLTNLWINFRRTINLQDNDLLELASGCRHLVSLKMNEHFGWGSPGITPSCLARLRKQCPKLKIICVALDTRGYIHTPCTQIGDHVSSLLDVNVVDSAIEPESVPALADFLTDQILHKTAFRLWLRSWDTPSVRDRRENWEVYMARWAEVGVLVNERLAKKTFDVGWARGIGGKPFNMC